MSLDPAQKLKKPKEFAMKMKMKPKDIGMKMKMGQKVIGMKTKVQSIGMKTLH